MPETPDLITPDAGPDFESDKDIEMAGVEEEKLDAAAWAAVGSQPGPPDDTDE